MTKIGTMQNTKLQTTPDNTAMAMWHVFAQLADLVRTCALQAVIKVDVFTDVNLCTKEHSAL